jgi:hypothetical protein
MLETPNHKVLLGDDFVLLLAFRLKASKLDSTRSMLSLMSWSPSLLEGDCQFGVLLDELVVWLGARHHAVLHVINQALLASEATLPFLLFPQIITFFWSGMQRREVANILRFEFALTLLLLLGFDVVEDGKLCN